MRARVIVACLLVALCAQSALAAKSKVSAASTHSLTTQMPEKCMGLQNIHGASAMNNWFLVTSSLLSNKTTPAQMCERALSCKKLLQPLMTRDNQYRRVCRNDCSGNGVCLNGVCSCSPGYKGVDCSIERCPGKCSSRGECKFGRCFCEPGFAGDNCETVLSCPQFGNKVCAGHGSCHRGKCYCDPGFTGESCAQVSRCPNDCSNRGFCLHGMCFCPPGFGGADCSTEVAASSCLNDCSGKGVCVRGKCNCVAGHFGADCSKVVQCPRASNGLTCGGYGTCHNGQCVCDEGRTGATCSAVLPCPGNGTCSGRGLCLRGTCYCYSGFEGSACDKETSCANGCSGNGVCVEGRCKCLGGYYGKECENSTPLAAMYKPRNCPPVSLKNTSCRFDIPTVQTLLKASSPCPNSCSGVGVCLNGTCACIAGHTGPDCSEVMEPLSCPNKCSLRGVCVYGKCNCMPPYKGADCSETDDKSFNPANATDCPKQCSGSGTCVRGRCVCDPGYAGHDCSLEVPCADNCNGRGFCDRGRCFCFPGFEGSSCDKPALCPSGCSAHGQCFYGKCFCEPYYAGDDCSQAPACTKGCSEHGICRGEDLCVCEPGWTGVSCSEKLRCPSDCSGPLHGVCTATERGVKCICKDGWMGDDCAKSIYKCPGDCNGKGLCLLGKCRCMAGFTGEACEQKQGGSSAADSVTKNLASITSSPAPKPAPGTATPRFAEVRTEAENTVVAHGVSHSGLEGQDTEDLPVNEAAAEAENAALGDLAADSGVSRKELSATDLAAKFRMAEMKATVAAMAGTCPNGCSGHGICGSDNKCSCDQGWEGSDCATESLCPDNCSGKGICDRGLCYCKNGATGLNCAAVVPTTRQIPGWWITSILCSVVFFVGLIVGRKTLASEAMKNLVDIPVGKGTTAR